MRRIARSRFKPTVRAVLRFGFLLFAGPILSGAAQPDNAAPVLISTDGGEANWKTTEQLKSVAARGDPKACLELGDLLLKGAEVPRDLRRAAALFEQAAKGGESNGWFRLGKISHDGLDGPVDYARALDYFTLAARAGIGEAQHNLGAMLGSGRGVKRDYVEGLAWLIIAAKSGVGADTEAQVRTRLAKRPDQETLSRTRSARRLGNHEFQHGVRRGKTTDLDINEARGGPQASRRYRESSPPCP